MLRDDRMMGMLTFVVILIAFGTLLQRYEGVQRLLGFGGATIELRSDTAMAQPEHLVSINVLANDVGVEPADAGRLIIMARPDCGRAFVRNGMVNYLGDSDCAGTRTFNYGLSGEEVAGVVRVSVAMTNPKQDPVADDRRAAAAPPAPAPTSPAVDIAPPPSALAASGPGGAGAPDRADSGRSGGDGATVPGRAAAAERTAGGTPALARVGPAAGTSAGQPTPQRGPAAPRAQDAEACTLPPALTLEAGPGAMTEVIVDAPCHASEAAELAYDGMRFAIPLDARGEGSLAVPGLQRASDAELTFGGADRLAFEISFRDIDRVERVAVVWQAPAGLALTALEFGARPGGAGHVRAERPRSFEEARREGGGWLTRYRPDGEVGQRIDVYTYWRRYGGPSGVVKLGLGPGADAGAGAVGPCGGATAKAADYRVLRSTGGRPGRVRLGRVAPLDCTVLAGRAAPALGDAVDDLIVRRR